MGRTIIGSLRGIEEKDIERVRKGTEGKKTDEKMEGDNMRRDRWRV